MNIFTLFQSKEDFREDIVGELDLVCKYRNGKIFLKYMYLVAGREGPSKWANGPSLNNKMYVKLTKMWDHLQKQLGGHKKMKGP